MEDLAAHPNARTFRTTTLADFDELDLLFTGKIATGNFARSTMAADAIFFAASPNLSDENNLL